MDNLNYYIDEKVAVNKPYEAFDQLNGNYRAKVIDNHDPEEEGKIKIWIPLTMSELPTESIWAYPAFHWGGRTEGKEYGAFLVPPIGSYVWVFFEGGDRSKPIYFAGVTLKQTKKTEPQADKPSENVFVMFKTPEGHTMYVSDNKNTITIFTKDPDDGHVITMDHDQKLISIITREQRSIILNDTHQQISIASKNHTILLDDASNSVTIQAGPGQMLIMNGNGSITVQPASGKQINFISDVSEFSGLVVAENIDVSGKIQTNKISASSYEPKAPPTQ